MAYPDLYTLSLHDALPISFIMHPGPMNRGFEISAAAADSPRALVLDQVENGVSVRMAVLYRLLTGQEETKDRKSTRLNSSHVAISYAVFCLIQKINKSVSI